MKQLRRWGLLVLAAACAEPGAPTLPELLVTVETTGTDLDPDGYALQIGTTTVPIPVNGTVTVPATTGTLLVTVSGIAGNCGLDQPNPQTVEVPPSGTFPLTLHVTCSRISIQLVVATRTLGQDPDSDGYVVTVNGQLAVPIGINAARTFDSLSSGAVSVTLLGVASHCTVSSPNPADVQLLPGTFPVVSFTVTCAPITARLVVTTATTGQDPDPNGYRLAIDDHVLRSLADDTTLTIFGLPPGLHEVALRDIASHCTTTGQAADSLLFIAGQTTSARFDVTCAPITAQLHVAVVATGHDPDPNGFSLQVGGDVRWLGLAPSQTFVRFTPGPTQVTLADLAPNCSATSANPVTLTLTAGVTDSVRYAVACAAVTGDLQIAIRSDGSDLPPLGYMVDWGIGTRRTTANDTMLVERLSPGTLSVALSGPARCPGAPATPDTVAIIAGDTTKLAFSLQCAPVPGAIAFHGDLFQVYWYSPIDATVERLTQTGFNLGPEWSPDGSALAYQCGTDLCVERFDGTAPQHVVASARDIAWRPDGGAIAFRSGGLWLIRPDGSGLQQIPNTSGIAGPPTWSPDGAWLAFPCRGILYGDEFDGDDICVVAPTGSGFQRLTSGPDFDSFPAWSRDGARIVFCRAFGWDQPPTLMMMQPDGSGIVTLFQDRRFASAPAWSPDGQRILYTTGDALWVVNADGTNPQLVTTGAGVYAQPAWRPR